MKKLGYIWMALIFGLGLYAIVPSVIKTNLLLNFEHGDGQVTEDFDMTTDMYNTYVKVNEDNTYQITESIAAHFTNGRHGIYRNIPYQGCIFAAGEKLPYRAEITLKNSNQPVSQSKKNRNQIFRFGSEYETVESGEYEFTYTLKPVTQDGYTTAYYNVYSTQWQNAIPAGSRFFIEFPKDFPHEILELYYGASGETKDAAEILDLSWDGNTVTGVLKEALPVGNGLTFYAPMEKGYFVNVSSAAKIPGILIAATLGCVLVVALLFVFFGRDEAIIPSIQYAPPEGIDSAAVGYIIDGSVEDKDLVSLIVYWADRGYIRIEEPKKGSIIFYKKKDLPDGAPPYEKTLFRGIFGAKTMPGTPVSLASLKYNLAGTMQEAKRQLVKDFNSELPRTKRTVVMLLTLVPLLFALVFPILSLGKMGLLAAGGFSYAPIVLLIMCLFFFRRRKRAVPTAESEAGRAPIYTKRSELYRLISGTISIVPLGAFTLVTGVFYNAYGIAFLDIAFVILYVVSVAYFCSVVDKWYARSGKGQIASLVFGMLLCVLSLAGYAYSYLTRALEHNTFLFTGALVVVILSSLALLVMTAFMKKRTPECTQWMGQLLGLRDFIKTAELDRMQMLAIDQPNLFYHIMPYAYVFGLSDVWMKKFEQIAVPAPEWYSSSSMDIQRQDFFELDRFNRSMQRNMRDMSQTFTSTYSSSSGGGGSSDSGSDSGSSSGGSSGGGFGGGGGGSW